MEPTHQQVRKVRNMLPMGAELIKIKLAHSERFKHKTCIEFVYKHKGELYRSETSISMNQTYRNCYR
jgi:hypothetical protein